METMVKIENVTYLNIIKYPDIQIRKNIATFITGESGCGKSTLLRLINGVKSADTGNITYQEKNINEYNPIQLRREILLCSQSVYLFDTDISGNFNEYYDYRSITHLNTDNMYDYLRICCLDLPLNTLCQTMSGGERHRVFIAICLSFIPKILMLDEPTSALDDKNAKCLIYNLKEFCKEKGITLIVVCHDKALSKQFADEIIELI